MEVDAPLSQIEQPQPIDPKLLDLPTEIHTPRLVLRAYRPGDGAMYYQAVQDNWQHLYEFMPYPQLEMRSVEEAENIIAQFVEEMRKCNLFIFATIEKESGSYVGETYLANPDWHVPHIELGYFIVQASTGKGYATEAARAAVRFAFEQLKVMKVELQCRADNLASKRVAEHCGFTFEGRQRLHHRKKTGELVDVLWYGLLQSVYMARNGG